MFNLQTPGRGGILGLDLEGSFAKDERLFHTTDAAEVQPESVRGLGDFGIKKASDPANAHFWQSDHSKVLTPRGGWGSWSFATPAMNQLHPNGVRGFIPLHSHANWLDEDFKPLTNVLSVAYGELTPGKALSVVVATTGHGKHEPVAIMSGGPLVADWLSSKAPKYSRWLFDIVPGGDDLDYARKAGLHTALRVRKWAAPCMKYAGQLQMAIALNFTKSPDGTGLGFAHFQGADAYLSAEAWGPLTPATITHEIGFGDTSIRSGAITTRALYHGGNPLRDGPLPFTEEDEPPVQEGIYPYRGWLMWRKPFKRKFLCGDRDGRWDLHFKLPVTETPPCNPTKISVKDSSGVPQVGKTATGAVYTAASYMPSGGFVGLVRPGNLKGKLAYQP
jgi:hypothetical protein